jgi:predicted DNA-binding protein
MFKVQHKEPMQNKTFRLPVALLQKMQAIAETNNITVNELVKQCCEYALSEMADAKAKEN